MDKILTKKIFGLKLEDILKCVLLVGVGYCIAVMLGNCNCVEGVEVGPFVCRAQTACSREQCVNDDGTIDLDCEACPGWQLKDPDDGTTEPWITTPSQLYTCEPSEDPNVGYGSREECIANTPYSLSEGPMGLQKKRGVVTECNDAPPYPPPPPTPPPPAPTPPPPAPTPPATKSFVVCETSHYTGSRNCVEHQVSDPKDLIHFGPQRYFCEGPDGCKKALKKCQNDCKSPAPTPPSECQYIGDSEHKSSDPGTLNQEWWMDSNECENCVDNISMCREEMKNYLKYHKEVPENTKYTGFCLQTLVGTNNYKHRGDCARKKLTGGMVRESLRTGTPGLKCSYNEGGVKNVCKLNDKTIFIADPNNFKGSGTFKKLCSATGGTMGNMAWVNDRPECNANCPNKETCPTTSSYSENLGSIIDPKFINEL